MPNPAITPDVPKTGDVRLNHPSKLALDPQATDGGAKPDDILFSQFLGLGPDLDVGLFEDIQRQFRPDPIDVADRILDPLFRRNVNTRYAWHDKSP